MLSWHSLLPICWILLSGGEVPAVQVEVGTDAERVYVDQLVPIHVDVVVRRLNVDGDWLFADPIPADDPPKLTIPWLNGTPWLQPVHEPVEFLRPRLTDRGVGFRINELFVEDIASPLLPMIRRRQAAVHFERSETELDDGSPAYRYRLTLSFRTTRSGATVPVTVSFEGNVYVEAERIGDSRLALTGSFVRARSNRFSLNIQPLPLRGRPRYFTGAVGRFRIRAEADRTDVRLSEPIQLTLVITGVGLLDRIAPPRLSGQPGWQLFRVHDEPISSEVTGDSRRFVYRIRPTSERLTKIPPVLWSFFDPVLGRYQTVATEAINLTVRPVQVVQLETESQDKPALETDTARLHGVRTGQVLLDDHRPFIRTIRGQIAAILVPLLIAIIGCSAVAVARNWSGWQWVRRRRLRRRVLLALDRLAHAPADEVARTLPVLVADLLGVHQPLPGGRRTADELTEVLTQSAVDGRLKEQVVALLRACEAVRFGARPVDAVTAARWCATVRELALQLTKGQPVAALAVAVMVVAHAAASIEVGRHREVLAQAAYRAWQHASNNSGELPARSEGYRLAAERYRLLLDTGLRNGYVLYNIGCCYLLADDLPRALRYFLWARQYIPRDRWLNENLVAVQSRLAVQPDEPDEDGLTPVMSARELQAVWLVGSAVGWGLLTLGWLGRSRRAKVSGICVLVVATVVAGAQTVYELARLSRPEAVVLHESAPRSGPGNTYEPLRDVDQLPAGLVVRRTRAMGGWVEVELAGGTTGWLRAEHIGDIEPPFTF